MSSEKNSLTGFGSVAIHSGHKEDDHNSHLTPIYASSTYVFDSAEQGMRRFKGEEKGYIYTAAGAIQAWQKLRIKLLPWKILD
jgi:methionine-gamma-lyase